MSNLFEALAGTRQISAATDADGTPKSEQPQRRRSSRSKSFIPVFVYGYGPGLEPFHEDAYSAVVSDNGGLLVMTAPVELGHLLLITNRATQEQRECRVAFIGEREPDQPAVAVEFMEPATGFWRLTTRSAGESADAKGSQ